MISELIENWIDKQRPFSEGGPFAINTPESRARKEAMAAIVDELEDSLSDRELMAGDEPMRIQASKGITLDTNVPWIRIYDSRTPRPTEGWSLVLFMSEDAKKVVLGIGLGVYKGSSKRETRKYTDILLSDGRYPSEYRARPQLGKGGIASAYESATPISKTWDIEQIQGLTDDDFYMVLGAFLALYDEILNLVPPMTPQGSSAMLSGKWLVQFNPGIWDFEGLIENGGTEFSFKVGNFKELIQEGDEVVIWRSGSQAGVVGLGRVTSAPEDRVADETTIAYYKVDADFDEVTTRIQVGIDEVFENFIPKTSLLKVLSKNTILTAPQSTSPFPVSLDEWNAIVQFSGAATEAPAKPSVSELANQLLFDVSWLEEIIAEVRQKKQVIFQGPPGTGKTFLAKAIAKHLSDGYAVVQFHPSYSYEDFVEGFRPAKHGETFTFELKPGPLVAIANEARANPDQTFVLIVDEINRGNLAKIFGELYFLLEYRDDEVTMQYRTYGETFTLPANLLLIGTMNTADRSIASLDMAIRRRFSFIQLDVDSQPISGLLETWLKKMGKDPRIAELLNQANSYIPDSRLKLGPSYFMVDSVETDLKKIWDYQVFPQLREVFFENQEALEALTFQALSRTIGLDT